MAHMDTGAVDAAVIGAGPNGLTAAVTLAQAGLRVRVYETGDTVGGGARTEALTLPGFRHDPCSAVHPLAAGSPALRSFPLERHGLEWVHPEVPLAHPFPDGSAAVLTRSPDATAASLGTDAQAYRSLVAPFLGRWNELAPEVLRAPLMRRPEAPLLLARFGMYGMQPAELLSRRFRAERARGLLAGMAAHAMAPLSSPVTGAIGLVFALAGHEVGWPFPRGGSQAIPDALAGCLRSLGGEIETGRRVRSLDELPPARSYLLDVSPTDMIRVAGSWLPARYVDRLQRYAYGPGVFKIDYALDGPVPWTARECSEAGAVHLGASEAEIGGALRSVHRGEPARPPFLITAQPSVFDPSRAPEGKHVLWVYAHVPHGWHGDATEGIEAQIERFAPGFRDRVLARSTAGPAELESYNPNYIGGDIACGDCSGLKAVIRPVLTPNPYATGNPRVFLCSSATPPGPGVHGMCGFHAAHTALRRVFAASPNGDTAAA